MRSFICIISQTGYIILQPLLYQSINPPREIDPTIHSNMTGTRWHAKVTRYRKEMFYLTTHLTHFNLRLYGKGPLRLESEREISLPPLHGLLFPISSEDSFKCIIHRQKNTLTGREIPQWVTIKDRSDDPSHHERTLYHEAT